MTTVLTSLAPTVTTPTSGTAEFNLDIGDIIEEAFEQAGIEARTGNDVRTARRSLNLLAIDWANRGIPMWTLEQGTISLTSGTSTYSLPVDTMDILEHTIRASDGGVNREVPITRISVSTYAAIPVKTTSGRPVQLMVTRSATPTITVWPVPADNSYTLVYWRMRRIQDVGSSNETGPDIPYRFLPCLVAGLAYYIAKKKPETHSRLPQLKADYEELWMNAATEDRERASWFVTPAIGR